jgi:hypothetical protein
LRCRHLLSAGRKSSLLVAALLWGLDLSSKSRRSQMPSAPMHSSFFTVIESFQPLGEEKVIKMPLHQMLNIVCRIVPAFDWSARRRLLREK